MFYNGSVYQQADREGSSADPKGDHKADPRKTHVAEKAPPPPEPKSPELDNAVDEEPEEKAGSVSKERES